MTSWLCCLCVLFQVDPNTGEIQDEEGYEDEYQLEELEVRRRTESQTETLLYVLVYVRGEALRSVITIQL